MVFKTILRAFLAYTLPIAVALGANPSSPTIKYKVGVIQIIEHPALNETCKGIQDELKDQGLSDNLQWSWDSAQGNPALATQIAQKYVGQEVNVLVAIGTTVAQAALNVARNSNIPVIFSSVTNPKAAKLEGNITGVSNFVSPKDQFDAIVQLLPNKKKIGVIYNPGEANSVILLAQMEEAAKAKGLELIPATASKTSEVAIAAQGLIKKVDAIFVNNDNTALAALNAVGQICRENKTPLFASDGDLKESGALALLGADQYKIGRQTGKMVATILLKNGDPSTIKIEFPKSVSVEVNEKVAKDLAIALPEALKKDSRGTT